jgi:hypothetical protein
MLVGEFATWQSHVNHMSVLVKVADGTMLASNMLADMACLQHAKYTTSSVDGWRATLDLSKMG